MQKKAIRTRKRKSTSRKVAEKKRRAVARKAVATKKLGTAVAAGTRLSLQKHRPPQWANNTEHSSEGLLTFLGELLFVPENYVSSSEGLIERFTAHLPLIEGGSTPEIRYFALFLMAISNESLRSSIARSTSDS